MAREDYDSEVDLLKGSRRMMAQMLLRRQQQANPNLAGNILQGLSMGLMGAFEGMDSRQREAAQNEIIDVLARRSQESPSAAAATAAITAAGPPVSETKPSPEKVKDEDIKVADAPQYLRPQADEPPATLSSEPGANPRAQELGRALLLERGRQRMGETAPPDDGSVWPPLPAPASPPGLGDATSAIPPNADPYMQTLGVRPPADVTLGDIPIGPQVPSMLTPASIDAASYSPMLTQGGQQAPPPGPSPGAPPPANFMDYGTTEWPVGSSGRPQQGSPEWQALQAYQASQGRPPQAPPPPAAMQPGYQPGPQSLAAPEQSPLASAQGIQAIQAAMPQQGQPQQISPQQRDLMIRTIYGEAGNQGPEGQQAVANVILNRARMAGTSPDYEILKKNQFEPWNNARARARMENLSTDSPSYQRASQALDAALQGDVTQGATHFYSPSAQAALGRRPPSWDDGSGRMIDQHRFFNLPYGGQRPPDTTASFGDARKGVLGPRQAPQEPPQPAPYQVAQAGGGLPPGPPQQPQSGLIQRLEELRRSPNPETRELARKHLYEEYTRKPSWEHMDTPVGRTFFNKNDPRQSFTVQHSPETLRAAAEQKGREAEATERGQLRAKTESAKEAARPGQQLAGTMISTDIDRVIDIVKKNPNTTTGLAGSAMRYAPTSAAHSIDKLLAGIKPSLGLQSLQALKAASPTGAGLGGVTEGEHKMLQDAWGSLDLSQNDQQFIYNLNRVKRIQQAIIHEGPEAAARAAAPPPAGGGQTKGGVKWSIEP